MIPAAYISEWRSLKAPWVQDVQVEQDLIIARAIVEIYKRPGLNRALAFRGGTALNRFYIDPPSRYSEDIDLVQVERGPAGPIMDGLREALDSWLGEPKRSRSSGRVTMVYKIQSEGPPALPMKLKVEINTEENFSVFGHVEKKFMVDSRWYSGHAMVRTFGIDELLATKMRALFQRAKARDMFDLWKGLSLSDVDVRKIVEAFGEYLKRQNLWITRAQFEANLHHKMSDKSFFKEVDRLLAPGIEWDLTEASKLVQRELISRLPGDPWKGEKAAAE